MKKILYQFFTWWNGQTIGTRFFTWKKGKKIGEDEFGNCYYCGSQDYEEKQRRWVIYKNYAEASSIPPGWHGWIHHRTDYPPSDLYYKPWVWQKSHQVNLTGSKYAYRPKGSLHYWSEDSNSEGDYKPWKPE